MSTQRHVIKRQTVEITLTKKEDAWALQQALSRIFRERVEPLLDQLLSEASTPGSLHRIDRLELDLGQLDRNRLEADVLERLDEKLRQALGERIVHAQSAPVAKQQAGPLPGDLELFEYFIREGHLPWWADSTQGQLPEKSFAALIDDSPEALALSLARLIQKPRCLQRLISYFDDSPLIDMLALITAAPKTSVTSLLQTLQGLQPGLSTLTEIPVSRSRTTLWQSLLQVAMAGEPAISRQVEFLNTVIARWSHLLGLSQKVLHAGLQRLASNESLINNEWLKGIRPSAQIEQPWAMLEENAVNNGLYRKPFTSPTATSPLAEFPIKSNRDETLVKPRILHPEQAKNEPNKTVASDIIKDDSLRQDADELATSKLLRRQSNEEFLPESDQNIAPTREIQPFSDADELYINNSGLCILWPFLASFFERLELVQNGHFHDPTARQCAVCLLHYLATEELDPPEYVLPFNKLLCGMEIDEVYDFSTPLTAAQIEACEELLVAVIGNAPILNNMSINGFRGSFLVRRGVLSTGPGSWLLRVEGETYDLVLDRFPWSWRWIKLPWMEAPLRVEWP